MRPIVLKAALAIALLAPLAPPVAAWAQDTPPPSAAERKPISKQELKDQKVVEKALQVSSFAQLDSQVSALKKVVAHAPASWPMVERGDDLITVRLNDPSKRLTVVLGAALAAADNKAGGGKADIDAVLNTYGMAAFLLGSRAVEMHQPDEALTWLDKGLAFQPDNPLLITEKGSALVLQHRFADALAFYDAQPAPDILVKLADPGAEARLLRARGFCLIELDRLDEAEAAYVKALKLEPDHGGAKSELDYIRKLKAGGAKQDMDVFTGPEAKARKAD